MKYEKLYIDELFSIIHYVQTIIVYSHQKLSKSISVQITIAYFLQKLIELMFS